MSRSHPFCPHGWDPLEDRVVPTQVLGDPAGGLIRAADVSASGPWDSTVPSQRLDDAAVSAHAAAVAQADSGGASNVVFFGDSIIARWDEPGFPGRPVWDSSIAPLGAADFGVDGDRTQNLIWRLENGELDGRPRVAVVLIGTNNLVNAQGDESPEATAAGVAAVVGTIRNLSPDTKILLLGLLPRGAPGDPVRGEIDQVNGQLNAMQDWSHVFYGGIGWLFLAPDGTIPGALLPDGLHPSEQGYQLMAEVLRVPLASLLGAPAPDPSTYGGPVLVDVPPDLVLEATQPGGAILAFAPPLAFDGNDPSPVVTTRPLPGALVHIGTTIVRVTATDKFGRSASASFRVEVRNTPVLLNTPPSRVVQAVGRNGTVVRFKEPTATDVNKSAILVTSSKPSGSTFPIGTTVVTFTARGASGATATSSMSITVVARDTPPSPTRRLELTEPATPRQHITTPPTPRRHVVKPPTPRPVATPPMPRRQAVPPPTPMRPVVTTPVTPRRPVTTPPAITSPTSLPHVSGSLGLQGH